MSDKCCQSASACRITISAQEPTFLTGPRDHEGPHGASSSSKILASFKSSVPKPSVKQP
jgi:hypothetical protein